MVMLGLVLGLAIGLVIYNCLKGLVMAMNNDGVMVGCSCFDDERRTSSSSFALLARTTS